MAHATGMISKLNRSSYNFNNFILNHKTPAIRHLYILPYAVCTVNSKKMLLQGAITTVVMIKLLTLRLLSLE